MAKKFRSSVMEEFGLEHFINDKETMFDEILDNLKTAFDKCDKRDKFKILTILPKDMEVPKIKKHFKISHEMVLKAKQLQESKGEFITYIITSNFSFNINILCTL